MRWQARMGWRVRVHMCRQALLVRNQALGLSQGQWRGWLPEHSCHTPLGQAWVQGQAWMQGQAQVQGQALMQGQVLWQGQTLMPRQVRALRSQSN